MGLVLVYINDRLMAKFPSADSVTVGSLKELGHQIGGLTGRNWSVILQHVDGTFPNPAVQNSNVYDAYHMKGGGRIMVTLY